MSRLRLLVLFSLVSLSPLAVAGTNKQDLSAYKGNFSGNGSVEVESESTFKGDSKIQGAVPGAAKSMKLKIKCSVKAGNSDIPIDNELQFKKSGKFSGKELAPGATTGEKFKGRYKVKPGGDITFKGRFAVGSTSGTFEGTAKAGAKGMSVTYSLFVKGEKKPFYVYTYYGKK